MRLAQWRKGRGWTQAELARRLGVTQPAVSTFERARNPAIPGVAVMIEIFVMSGGAVQPNDFYDLPDIAALDDLQGDVQAEAA